MRRFLIGLVASLLALLPARAADQGPPDATIELSGGSVALGIGYTWGSGKLVFQGKQYLLNVSGLSIADVGVSNYTATGSVYNLKKPEDIEGTYAGVTAGATVAGGVSGAAMRNQNGVLIQLSATREGLQFTFAPAGIKITLVK